MNVQGERGVRARMPRVTELERAGGPALHGPESVRHRKDRPGPPDAPASSTRLSEGRFETAIEDNRTVFVKEGGSEEADARGSSMERAVKESNAFPHVISVVGARPQFIKASVVCRALKLAGARQEVIHTGQHYDREMSNVFFAQLDLPSPMCDLEVGSGLHAEQIGKMLERLAPVLRREAPDVVLLFGDTNSTLAGALAASTLHIPVGHVEAGLRSFNRGMAEERNRIVTDHLADFLFAPTAAAVSNLEREGLGGRSLFLSGDVMFDAALSFGAIAEESSRILQRLRLESDSYILATIHRAENTEITSRLVAILAGLGEVANGVPVVLPLHPRTRDLTVARKIPIPRTITVIEPVDYLDMLKLERHASLIVTDSGGVQKEAFFSEVPCVTLRDETEWVELVDMGWNTLVQPTDADHVAAAIRERIGSKGALGQPYGDGGAARRIAEALGRCVS
jgi:UDP-GlcNAc3NAcA epimerase